MELADLKEKLRSAAPLDLLEKLKEALSAFCSNVISLIKGLPGRFLGGRHSGPSNNVLREEASPSARKKRLILFGLGGAAVLLFGLIITFIIANAAKPKGTGLSNIAADLSIPSEEFFSPSEPDFLPGFLPEKEPRRFWSLEDIRQYWKAPGNSDWWMEAIKTTVDSLMEGVP
jgi:hypothetical protein